MFAGKVLNAPLPTRTTSQLICGDHDKFSFRLPDLWLNFSQKTFRNLSSKTGILKSGSNNETLKKV